MVLIKKIDTPKEICDRLILDGDTLEYKKYYMQEIK